MCSLQSYLDKFKVLSCFKGTNYNLGTEDNAFHLGYLFKQLLLLLCLTRLLSPHPARSRCSQQELPARLTYRIWPVHLLTTSDSWTRNHRTWSLFWLSNLNAKELQCLAEVSRLALWDEEAGSIDPGPLGRGLSAWIACQRKVFRTEGKDTEYGWLGSSSVFKYLARKEGNWS